MTRVTKFSPFAVLHEIENYQYFLRATFSGQML